MIKHEIRKQLNSDALVFDNPAYDQSIIGQTFDGKAIYDIEKMAEELAIDDNITLEEAIDFIDYNAARSLSYAGERAPVIVHIEY